MGIVKQKQPSRSAFTILEMVFLLFMIGIIVAFVVPNEVGSRRSGPAWNSNACINNLRQIDAAANQFALEHNLTNGDRINYPNDLTPYIKLNSARKIPPCPSGGIYHIGRVGKTPTCSLGTTVNPTHVLP